MSAAQHTLGPWAFTVQSDGEDFKLTAGAGKLTVLAGCGCCGSPYLCGDDHMADARLIAAAPELLAALQSLLNEDGGSLAHSANNPVCVAVRAAIAKATGSTT